MHGRGSPIVVCGHMKCAHCLRWTLRCDSPHPTSTDVDVATLGLRIDANGAVRDVQGLGQSLDSLATKGLAAASRLKSSFLGISAAAGLGIIASKILKESI